MADTPYGAPYDPAMDDPPCPDCGSFDLDCWVECDECEYGMAYVPGDVLYDTDADEWGGVYRTCWKCNGEAGWCGQPTVRNTMEKGGPKDG